MTDFQLEMVLHLAMGSAERGLKLQALTSRANDLYMLVRECDDAYSVNVSERMLGLAERIRQADVAAVNS